MDIAEMVGSKRRSIGLGGFPDVTLAQARDDARESRAKIRAGIDPVDEKRVARGVLVASANALIFADAAKRWHSSKQHEYQNDKHAVQVLSSIVLYAFPSIGHKKIAEIELADIVGVLEPIWTTKTETASRLRGGIENVLSWAAVSGHRSSENPARWKGNLDAILPKPGRITKVRHHKALPASEVPDFYSRLTMVPGAGARALEFCILTAARSGEVRGALWEEFDLDEGIWTIPAERMKAGREHRVPLTDAALNVLENLPRLLNCSFAFASTRGGMLSDMTLSAVLRRMDVPAVPHGFRSTFGDWVSETTSFDSEVAEMALAHTIRNKVEAAYRRGDLFEKRRHLMEAWSAFCHQKIDRM